MFNFSDLKVGDVIDVNGDKFTAIAVNVEAKTFDCQLDGEERVRSIHPNDNVYNIGTLVTGNRDKVTGSGQGAALSPEQIAAKAMDAAKVLAAAEQLAHDNAQGKIKDDNISPDAAPKTVGQAGYKVPASGPKV